MHGVHPSLIVVLWVPFAQDIVAILIKFQVKPDGISWATAETVVLWVASPRINYLFHLLFYSSSILSTLKMTGRVPSEQQQIISFSRFIHPFIMEPPCKPV